MTSSVYPAERIEIQVLAEAKMRVDDVPIHVGFHARRLAKRFHLSMEDRSDIQQELAIEVWNALHRYDSSQSHPRTFINRILARHCQHLTRHFITMRSYKVRCPQSLSSDIEARLATNLSGTGEPTEHDLVDLRLDLATVLNGLPDHLRQIAEALMTYEPSEVAEHFNVHRSTVYRAIGQIRICMIQAGMSICA